MNMSVSMTTAQCVAFEKTVTRRNGWWNVKVGQIIQLIKKGQGLKKGEKVERIHRVQVLSARAERLDALSSMPEYGWREMAREGFPQMEPEDFIKMYCKANKSKQTDMVNRIEFRYLLVEDGHLTLPVPEKIAVCPACKKPITVSPDVYYETPDGSLACDTFTTWCKDDHLSSHEDLNATRDISKLPFNTAVGLWLNDTFRFEYADSEIYG